MHPELVQELRDDLERAATSITDAGMTLRADAPTLAGQLLSIAAAVDDVRDELDELTSSDDA